MPDLTTASVVVDFIRYKLSSEGLDCPSFGAVEGTDEGCDTLLKSSIQTAMRELTHEIEHRFHTETNGLAITDSLHVTPGTAFTIFQRVVHEIFYCSNNSERIHTGVQVIRPSWGRICSLLAFSSALAVHCVQNEMPQMVDQVANWTIGYIDTYLLGWINRNGGWKGLIPPTIHTDPWLSYRTVLGVAVVGAITVLAVKLVR